MAITYEVKFSQSDVTEGRAYNAVYFADEDYADGTIGTTGLGLGKLVGIKDDGESLAYGGKTAPTLQYADASSGIKAVGFVWRASAPAVDTTITDQLTNIDANYYPYGDREDTGLVMIKRGAIVVKDTTRDYYFNTTKKAITGTVEVAGGALDDVVGTGTSFTTELRVGDLIEVDGQVKEVVTITDNTNLVVGSNFSGAVAAGEAIYISSDLFRPVFLGEDGLFKVVTPTSGLFKQTVGYVVNGNNILVNLELDITGATV